LSDLGEFALDLARRASAMMADGFELGTKRSIKADGSPVTEIDIAINKMVVDAIHATYPDHSLVGEEESNIIEGSEWTWVCDPLDGTVPFTHGLPVSTFALALTRNGEPILSVITDPYCKRTFLAETEAGATLNGRHIAVSAATTLQNQVVVFECPAFRPEVDATVRAALSRSGATVLTIRSSLYCSALVACGEVAGVIYVADSPWDAAAAAVIVPEAGGRLTDLAGNNQRYDQPINGYVASNGLVHDEILRCIGDVTV
jgi:myo-inositol-1(or 4)-monophosphatase